MDTGRLHTAQTVGIPLTQPIEVNFYVTATPCALQCQQISPRSVQGYTDLVPKPLKMGVLKYFGPVLTYPARYHLDEISKLYAFYICVLTLFA